MYCSTKGYYLSLFSSNLQVQFFYFKTSHVIVYQLITWLEWTWICISKHLMLLFIAAMSPFRWIIRYFKTSHVIVYPKSLIVCKFSIIISKHLMLLFINYRIYAYIYLTEFQNISCYCLSIWTSNKELQNNISKHLMLLFITFRKISTNNPFTFQNISCYCLSEGIWKMRYCSRYFKTSHVIVYLLTMLLSSFFLRYFKTSHVIVYLEFRDRFLCKIHYFKTSHVIVYRSICRFLRIRLCNFKTSHVIVYLRIFLCFFLIVVSFQNISCYCLSAA